MLQERSQQFLKRGFSHFFRNEKKIFFWGGGVKVRLPDAGT